MSSYGYYPLIGILIEPKSAEVSFLGRIGQVEQVCLNLKQRTPGLIRERLEEEERIPTADVSISKGGSWLNIYISQSAWLL